jgi:hypothetical protein
MTYTELKCNFQHLLKTIAEESYMWHKVVFATDLFEGITNTPDQQAFLLEGEGEEIFLQINQLMDTLDQVPIAQTDKYYRNAVAELVHFIKLGQMAMNIRREPDTAESKYNQTILVQYQSLLLRTPRRLPYDGLGNSMEIPLHDILS